MNSAPRICIDGYNLALEKGTGIATYARNLSHAAKATDLSPEVLYGTAAWPGKNPLFREIGFFDPPPPSSILPSWVRKPGRAFHYLKGWSGRKAYEIPQLNYVVRQP